MAAKIIKGGGDVPARSLAVHARTPQVAGDKKVIDKELYSVSHSDPPRLQRHDRVIQNWVCVRWSPVGGSP